ncbi:MAG: hypothetical protein ACREI9_12065 [Nitrospiraceae bacterium]
MSELFPKTDAVTRLRVALACVLGLALMACATPLPKAGDYQRQAPPDYLGLTVDSDLLTTSRLDQEDRHAAQDLLKSYYSAEYSLRAYADALEKNLGANEHLSKEYSTAEAFVGGVAGLSSIGVIFATAAIAVPVTGVIWIGVSQYIQHYEIDPHIKKIERQLAEAEGLLKLFPDVEKIFDGLAFAESYDEAHRRFKKWAAYVNNLEARTARFFAKSSDESTATGGGAAGTPSPSTPPAGPSPKD